MCTVIIVMTLVAGLCSAPLGPRQVAWLAATESRVKSTMTMISSFKEVKMLGLSPSYLQNLQKLRMTEVELGRYLLSHRVYRTWNLLLTMPLDASAAFYP